MKVSYFILTKFILVLSLLWCGLTLDAATCTFTNGAGDNLWSNAANWDTGFVPGSGDNAVISSVNVTVDINITVQGITVSGTAVLTFSHPGVANIDNFTISGGSINSSNKIVINNSFIWSGTSSITSSSDFELSASCSGNISGSGNRNLYANLLNNGTCTHSGGSLRFQTGGGIENNGTFTSNGATFIINTGGNVFLNKGNFDKTDSGELNFFANLNQEGNGKININAGTLKFLLGNNNTDNTQINIASGASLNISSGSYTLGANSSINGAGNIDFLGGTFTISGAYNLSGMLGITGGTINFNTVDPTSINNLSLSGGIMQGSSQIQINNNFSWSNTSTVQISDTLKLSNTCSTLIFGGGSKNLYSPVINDGNISHTDGSLRFHPGSFFQNNGTYSLNGPTEIFDDGGGSFDNNGLFDHQKNGSFSFGPDFNNNKSGIVKGQGNLSFVNLNNQGVFLAEVTYGTMQLTGTYANGESLDIEFDNADHGAIETTGDISLSGTLNINISGSVPVGTYTILSSTSGSISGTFGTLNIPGDFSIEYNSNTVNLLVGLLPVELTKFELEKQARDILLSWQTATEFNSEKFVVEHSTNGINFYSIGELEAAGFSQEVKDYRFIHQTPANGNNYYRLKQIDKDETFEYSDLRAVSFFNFGKDLSVYPNPTHGPVVIKNQSDKSFSLKIIDIRGTTIMVKHDLMPGATSLDLSHLPKAMYTLEIYDDGYFSHKERLLILE